MPTSLVLRKAQKQKAKLRVGIFGPSGAGKTYSALLLASGMALWEKIAIIDSENGSADLYAHLGPYNVLPITAPFSPEKYIEAIHACEESGMEVIIIDSVSHEWEATGGVLLSNELLAQNKFKGNTWSAWSKSTPRHQLFLEAILTSPCHVITTARSKTETIQLDGKVKKVGTKEIQRDGFEYELTINFSIDREGHYAVASKDRTGLFTDVDPFIISEKTGQLLRDWSEQGVFELMIDQRQITQLRDLLKAKAKSEEKMLESLNIKSIEEMSFERATKLIKDLGTLADASIQ